MEDNSRIIQDRPARAGARVLVAGIGRWGAAAAIHAMQCAEESGMGDAVRCVLIEDPAVGINATQTGNVFPAHVPLPADLGAEYINDLRADGETWTWLTDPVQHPAIDITGRPAARMAFFNAEQAVREAFTRACGSPGLTRNDETAGVAEPADEWEAFILASAGDNYAGAIFIDAAALLGDITGADGGTCRINGILLNPACTEPGEQTGPMAAAYALFTEIEAFTGGRPFIAQYPSGFRVENSSLFRNGTIYLLDRGGTDCGRYYSDDDLYRCAGLFCAAAASAPWHGSWETDSGGGKRTPPWGSFGIASAVWPFGRYRERACGHFVSAAISGMLSDPGSGGGLSSGLNAADALEVFRSRYPEYETEISSAAEKIAAGINAAAAGGGMDGFRRAADEVIREYSGEGIGRFDYPLTSRMGMRSSIDLVKCRILAAAEFERIAAAAGGLKSALREASIVMEQLSGSMERYTASMDRIEFYSAGDMTGGHDNEDINGQAMAVIETASFNYRQAVYRSMLIAAREYTSGYIKIIAGLCGRIHSLIHELEIQRALSAGETPGFMDRRLGPDMVHEIEWPGDYESFISAYFSPDIKNGEHRGRSVALPEGFLEPGCGFSPAGTARMIVNDLYNIASSLFDSDKLKESIAEADASARDINEKIFAMSGIAAAVKAGSGHAVKEHRFIFAGEGRPVAQSEPGVQHRIITAPGLCRPWESFALTVARGLPLSSLNSIELQADEYTVINGCCPQLHVFEGAQYWPDPLDRCHYTDPARLWSGLLLLDLVSEHGGNYVFDEELHPFIREIEARQSYKKTVLEVEEHFTASGGYAHAGARLLADAAVTLGLMARTTGGGMVFRREYSGAAGELAAVQGGSPAEPPVFANTEKLAEYIKESRHISEFIRLSVQEIINRTKGSGHAGAYMLLPRKRVEQYPLPVFSGSASFAEYCGSRGSCEFYAFLNSLLEKRLAAYINSKFMAKDKSAAGGTSETAAFLKAVESRMPEAVIRRISVSFGLT